MAIFIYHLKIMASIMRVFLILLWTMVQQNIPQAAGVQVFPPVNFTLTVSSLAQVLLHWEPNPNQEQKNYTIRYDVKILSPVPEEYDTKKTHSIRTAALHNGFSAHVRTLLLRKDLQMRSDWVKESLPPPPGAPGTSVTNLSCVTRITISSTVSLHCSWLPGQWAPEDTKYSLFYRKKMHNVQNNFVLLKKGIDCPIKEKVNVPRNVTVFLEQNDLLATWEKPISPFPKECFEYEFYLFNLKSGNKQILKISSNDFRLQIDVTSRYSIQIRANHRICRTRGFWSDWSEITYVGKNDMLLSCNEYHYIAGKQMLPNDKQAQHQVIFIEARKTGQNNLDNSVTWILTVLCVSTCCTFLLVAIICKINHVWSKLFPPIPTPSNKFRDPFPIDYERARTCTSETETEFSSFAEDLYCSTLDNSVF
ncbi:Il5ra [Columba livia]|nr:Il5ra [Columba livia]